MNLNHDPDKHLLDQIDKRLESGQPSGNALLEELATTRPIPRPAVQSALEERLLAQLEKINQGETTMASTSSYMSIDTPRRNWLPLTLLAALIVVAIAGVMLINGIGKSPKINEMALAAPTLTPTPTGSIVPPVLSQNLRIPGVGGVQPVVIALHDIPRGTVLSSRWLSVAYWQVDESNQTYTDPDVLRGLVANQDIPRWQPILPTYLSDQPVSTIQPTDVPSPNVNVVVAFQNLPRGYTFSDRDLSNAAGYSGWPADKVPDGAIRDNDQSNIMMLEGKTLQTAVSRGQPILISDLSGSTTQNVAAPTSPAVHNTSVVQIRLSALTGDSLLPGVGGSVDVVALLPFKADSNIGDIPSTPMPDGIRLVETYVLRNTLVFYHGDRSQPNAIVAISASVNDSRLLAWLAEQPQVMFRLQTPLNNVFDITDNNTIVNIPFANVTAAENIQPGDHVNVISTCAFVPDVMGVNNTVISSKTDCTQSVEETRAVNVQVFIGEIVVEGRQPVMSYDSIALVMPKDAVPLFTKLNDSQMHFKLVKSSSPIQATQTETSLASPTISSTATPITTPTPVLGSRVINIRRDHLLMNTQQIMRGDSVNLIAVCAFIPETTDNNNETIPAKIDCSQKTETQVVSAGLVLMSYVVTTASGNDSTISIAVYSREEAQILPMIDAGMVFKVVKTDSAFPYFTINIPLGIIDSLTEPLQVGDSVDIYSTCLVIATPSPNNLTPSNLTTLKADCTQAVMQQETTGQIVATNDTSLSISLPSQAQSRLYDMISGGMHFKLVKSATVGQPIPTPAPVPIPNGRVTVDIPIASLASKAQYEKLQAGDYVDVIATFLSINDSNSTPSNRPQILTLEPGQTPDQITKRIAQGALITNAGFILTLAVSPDEAKVIQGVLDTKLSIQLRPVPAINTLVPPPSYSLDLSLDSVSHWAADDFQVGDKVDVVVGLVLGDGSDLKLEFKPYGEYNWIGAPFNGANTAQTYIPLISSGQSSAVILRRILQNATVTAVTLRIDPNSGQAQMVAITIEIQSETASTDGSSLKQWSDVGMPYLVVKH